MKQADALLPVIFNFALQYATGKDRVNLERMKLNDTHQRLLSADGVNLLADRVYNLKRDRQKERNKQTIKKKRNLYFCWTIMRRMLWEGGGQSVNWCC